MSGVEGLLGLVAVAAAGGVLLRQWSPRAGSPADASTSTGTHSSAPRQDLARTAVIAVRTSGYARTGDRVLEIAVVVPRFAPGASDAHDAFGGDFVTLIRPASPGGAEPAAADSTLAEVAPMVELTGDYLRGAPTFAAIAPALTRMLVGRRLLAWQGERTAAALSAEYVRAGLVPPSFSIESVSRAAAGRPAVAFGRPAPNHRLSTLALAHSAPAPALSAYSEASTVAAVLPALLSSLQSSDASHHRPAPVPVGCEPLDADAWTDLRRRSLGRPLRTQEESAAHPWVSYLFSTLPVTATETHDEGAAAYVEDVIALLSRRTPAVEEVRRRSHLLLRAGHRPDQVAALHQRLLEGIRAAVIAQAGSRQAGSGQAISAGHVRLLRGIAAGLGTAEYVDDIVVPEPVAPASIAAPAGSWAGSSAGSPAGSFARPVRRPAAVAPEVPRVRCARCLGWGHLSPACPRG